MQTINQPVPSCIDLRSDYLCWTFQHLLLSDPSSKIPVCGWGLMIK